MPDTNDQDEDIHRRLDEANAALSKKKDSLPALRTKAIALIKLDRDAEALKLFDESSKLHEAATTSAGAAGAAGAAAGKTRDRQLECAYAYALYKGGRFEDVWRYFGGDDANRRRAVKGAGSRGLRHILAQTVSFRDLGLLFSFSPDGSVRGMLGSLWHCFYEMLTGISSGGLQDSQGFVRWFDERDGSCCE